MSVPRPLLLAILSAAGSLALLTAGAPSVASAAGAAATARTTAPSP